MLGDVEESVITREVDMETDEEIIKVYSSAYPRIFPKWFASLDVEEKHRNVVCPRRHCHSSITST